MNKVEFLSVTKASLRRTLRQLHRRAVGRAEVGRILRQSLACHRRNAVRGRALGAADVEHALDAAHAAKDAWGKTSAAERAVILNAIAQRMQDNLPMLAEAETWDNGKPIRETTAADLPLAIDHFRYFAGARPGAGRRHLGDRSRYRRVSLPRTAGRRRPDHPVEFPAADGGLEAGAGPRRRQLRGAQARRADAGLDHGAGSS